MEGLVDYVRRQVKCPECRAEHRIPYNGIQGFPANVTLQRFLEAQIEITGETPDPHTGQVMERCGVCNEKNYLSVCAHCEKKICEGCKNAHADVLKREIGRINNQVKRASHRLTDQLDNVSRNITAIKSNTTSVRDEIENISKRLQKAIRDREDYLKSEVQNQFTAEMRSMQMLHDGLEQEISNMNANIELADKHMDDDTPWTDGELMDTKEIFLKTMEFIRSFDYDSGGDYSRKTRFMPPDDLNKLASTLSNMGELNIPNKSGDPYATVQSFSSGGLSKSKSDHRLAVQFREQEAAHKTSPVTRRRFGERPPPAVESEEPNEVDTTRRRFRSRFIRREDEEDKGVKFPDEDSKTNRPKCFDTEDVSRGPLSGIVRIFDSPKVIQRLQERDVLIKRKKEEAKNPPPPISTASAAPASITSSFVPPRAARQMSEDEIDKIKKQNKSEESTSTSNTFTTTNSSLTSTPPVTEPASALDRLSNVTESANEPSYTSSVPPEDDSSSRRRDYTTQRSTDTGGSTVSSVASTRARFRNGTPETSVPERRYSRDNSIESNLSHDETASSSRRNSTTPLNASRLSSLAESSNTKASTTPSTKPSRWANSNNSASTGSGSSRYSSRFLGRAATPSAETSKESSNNDDEEEEEDESSDETETEESEESSEEEEEKSYTSSILNNNSSRTYPQNTSSSIRSRNSNDSGYSSRYGNTNDSSSSRYGATTNGTSSNSTYNRRPSVYESKKDDELESKYNYSGSKYLSRNRKDEEEEQKSPFQSRFLNRSKSSAVLGPDGVSAQNDESPAKGSGRARFEEMKEKRQRLARSKSSAGLDEEDGGVADSTPAYKSKYSRDNDIKSNVANRTLGPSSPTSTTNREESGSSNAQLSNWARYLKNKYGNKSENSSNAGGTTSTTSSLGNRTGVNGSGSSGLSNNSASSSTARAISRSKSSHLLGLPKENGSSEDDLSKNVDATPTFPASAAQAAGTLVVPTHPIGDIHRNQYLIKNKLLFQFGSRGSDPRQFTWPRGVAVGPNDSIVVADSSNHRVQVFDGKGNYVKDFGSYGTHYSEFDCLAGITVNRIGQFIISDRYNHRIQIFDPTGTFLRSFGSKGSANGRFSYPWGIATDAIGFIYVCDKDNHRIQVFQSDGTFVGKFGGQGSGPEQLEHPHYIAVSSTNKVIVSDSNNHRIQIFDVNGKIQSTFGGEGAEEGKFKFPRGVAVDDHGYIIVADSGNNRVQIFNSDGIFVKSFGRWGSADSEFKGMEGVAVTSDGKILVSDRENHRVQVF